MMDINLLFVLLSQSQTEFDVKRAVTVVAEGGINFFIEVHLHNAEVDQFWLNGE